ncbi:hypothetical protein PM082_018453 [Marasmius tenuissimus]|nr:hypothetical protein PM082_018453 [Marasmius tenuissimus]
MRNGRNPLATHVQEPRSNRSNKRDLQNRRYPCSEPHIHIHPEVRRTVSLATIPQPCTNHNENSPWSDPVTLFSAVFASNDIDSSDVGGSGYRSAIAMATALMGKLLRGGGRRSRTFIDDYAYRVFLRSLHYCTPHPISSSFVKPLSPSLQAVSASPNDSSFTPNPEAAHSPSLFTKASDLIDPLTAIVTRPLIHTRL